MATDDRNVQNPKRVSRGMGWLVFLVIALVVWGVWKLNGATVYISGSSGFTSYSFGDGEPPLTPVSRERYERVLARFIKGDLFDSLWVSQQRDSNGGLVLSLDGKEIQMDVSFLSLKEPARLAAFRKGMASLGHVPVQEDPWNVGLGKDLESVTLEYRFPKDLPRIKEAVDQALVVLEGPSGDAMFVNLWHSKDGPSGSGIKVELKRDILSEVP